MSKKRVDFDIPSLFPDAFGTSRKGRFTDLDSNKLRGGYYTSAEVATWLCSWAIRTAKDQVLEPSCGNGAFLAAAASRFAELGTRPAATVKQLVGVEFVEAEAENARSAVSTIIGKEAAGIVHTGDFFEWFKERPASAFDAVIGNPPFIRYQSFPEPHRSLAMAMMQSQGLTPNKLTNIWVPFVVAAAASLKPGGRLALVLPAEILQVTYAAQLRSFLTDRFKRIDIVACNELFFEKAEQEVVLLLADGALSAASEANTCSVTMTEAKTVCEITNRSPAAVLAAAKPKTVKHDNEKWLKYFLTNREITFMRALKEAPSTTSLSTHASVDVGVVTGKNEFFVLTSSQVSELGLEEHTSPLVSRSIHLRGAKVRKADWNAMARAGDRVFLLHVEPTKGKQPTGPLGRYIEFGEGHEVHRGYKCSIRPTWYAVPSVWNPDGFLFRQIYDFPRVVLNQAGATSTDTIHRLTAREANPEHIIANTYTWLTAASAEIEGRSYGGGVLELEPTEAERLMMPAILNGAMPLEDCDKLTRAGKLDQVLETNAEIVLREHMGLTKTEALMLRDIWMKMRDRRMARRKRGRVAIADSVV